MILLKGETNFSTQLYYSIIPPTVKIGPVKNIGFATDFNDPDSDMKFIKQLVELAKVIKAEVFIVHVCLKGDDGPEFEKSVEKILLDICCDNNYPKIQYKAIKNAKEKQGLDWLIDTGEIDLLVVIHHHQDFFERLIKRSLSSKLASNLSIPLLIYKRAINQHPI